MITAVNTAFEVLSLVHEAFLVGGGVDLSCFYLFFHVKCSRILLVFLRIGSISRVLEGMR